MPKTCSIDYSDWRLERSSSIALYKQIEHYMKSKILSMEWEAGARLPAQRELAKQLGVNRSTLVAALDCLTDAGFIEGNSGGGTVISDIAHRVDSMSPILPNWNAYVEEGSHYPNLPIIQTINNMEFSPKMIRMGTGELAPDLLPTKEMEKTTRGAIDHGISLGYEQPLGHYPLREQLSKQLSEQGIEAAPNSILIVSGALQALQLIAAGLVGRGSTMLVEKPSYLYSIHAFQSAGLRMVGVPIDQGGIQVDALEQYALQYKASLLYTIPSFHNPTGTVMEQNRREALMNISNRIGLPIIEDSAYEALWLDAPGPRSLKSMDKHGQVLYVGTMSKCVCPGLRMGWIVGSKQVIERLADIKMQMDYGSSSLSQQVAAEWLRSGIHQSRLQHIRAQLRLRRDFLLDQLRQHWSSFAAWRVPQGGFYIWVTMDRSIAIEALFKHALACGILLNPGHIYDRSSKHQLRLSYAYASFEEMERAILLIAKWVKSKNVTE